jgi:hypothetical protein
MSSIIGSTTPSLFSHKPCSGFQPILINKYIPMPSVMGAAVF